MADDDRLDRILEKLGRQEEWNRTADEKFANILAVLDAQGKMLDAHGQELDGIHLILRRHSMSFGQILERLDAMGHRI